MTPTSVTQEVMAAEWAAVTSWAGRHNWRVEYDSDALLGLAVVEHEAPGLPLRTVAFAFDVTGYPAAPPAWWCVAAPDGGDLSVHLAALVNQFTDNDDGDRLRRPIAEARHFPAPGPNHPPQLPGSIFHPNPVICAPWNRLAYQVNGGPHGDWGSLTDWKSAGQGYTQAHTVPDMLSALQLHLRYSKEMQPA